MHVLLGRVHRHPLFPLVRPRTPARDLALPGSLPNPAGRFSEVDALSTLVSTIESDGKGIPTLVREYLKLGGQFLGFNVDPDFADVLDGLVLVDLTKTNPRLLDFYMGRGEASAFRKAIAAACPDASQS
jgi:hypothetical protein